MSRPILLLTRPKALSDELSRRLIASGVDPDVVLIAPLAEPERVSGDWSPDNYAGFVFTSGTAVRFATTDHALEGATAWCVGQRTAELAAQAGMYPRTGAGNADDLLALIVAERASNPLLHLRGEDSRGRLADRLTSAGIETHEIVIYRQASRDLSPAVHQEIDQAPAILAPVYSPKSACRLGFSLKNSAPPLHLVAISQETASAWTGPRPASLNVASEPTSLAVEKLLVENLLRLAT